ncbi:glycoprotein [Wuchang Cockroach Virus 3]|uniref:Glycoprotein n=1 Tax=Wuchang Cockroach Virus 3 TaxID=1608099 RepID=A0A0B5KX96_9VIRU|nr:glycoprotein [Wuchang Cockroach Virus 3]AJG39068.1 glycoprotein [Wuchang Cockroach Virus 3]
MSLFFVLLGVIQLWPAVDGLVAYDCSHPNLNISTISTKHVEPCIPYNRPIQNTTVVIQLIQLEESFAVPVHYCNIEITRIVTHCGMHSHASMVSGGLATYMLEMPVGDCRKAYTTQQVRLPGGKTLSDLQIGKEETRSIVFAGRVNENSDCQGTDFSDRYGSWSGVIVQGYVKYYLDKKIAQASADLDKVHLPTGISCRYTPGHCVDYEKGYAEWDTVRQESCSPHLHTVLYQGPATKIIESMLDGSQKTTYLVQTPNRLFALRIIGDYTQCPAKVHSTEHPRLVIQQQTEYPFLFPMTIPSPASLDMMTYVNTKFVYLDRTIGKSMQELYSEVEFRRCVVERKSLLNLLSMATAQPNEFAYALMEGPGYTAIAYGEVVHLIQCVPINVEIRKTQKCYKELPISHQNQSAFMTPRNRLLQTHGTEIACDVLLNSQFQLNSVWYGFTPSMHAAISPRVLSPYTNLTWEYISPSKLASAGIYTDDDLKTIQQQVLYAGEREAIENIVVRGVSGSSVDLQGINGIHIIPDEALHDAANKYWTKLWGWFSGFGNISAGVIGVIMVFRLIKFLLDSIVHGKALYEIYGLSIYLVGAIWDSVTTYLIHRRYSKASYKSETDHQDNSDLDKVVTINGNEEAKDILKSTAQSKEMTEAAKETPSTLYPILRPQPVPAVRGYNA